MMWNIAVDWTSPATFTQDLINPLQCREYHQVVTLLDCIFYIYLGITVVRAALPDKIFFFLEKTSHTMNSIQSHKKNPTKTNKNPDTQTLNLFFFFTKEPKQCLKGWLIFFSTNQKHEDNWFSTEWSST